MAGTISEHAATAANREKLVSFFAAGASNSRKVGVEMEHVVVRSGSGAPVGYSGPDGIGALLEDLSASYTTVTPVHEDGTGGILGLRRSGHVITLEPASQFEISMRPFERVADVGAEYERFRATLDPALERIDAETPLVGYHPTTHVDDLELIPKYRYACMDRHFCEIGTLGRGMMRGSASLQVSVDYRNEADAVAKLRAASAIGPLTYLMLDNAPVFNGQWRTRHCVREMCWTGCDPDRCMVVPRLFDEGFGFADYANWMLATPRDPRARRHAARGLALHGQRGVQRHLRRARDDRRGAAACADDVLPRRASEELRRDPPGRLRAAPLRACIRGAHEGPHVRRRQPRRDLCVVRGL